MKGNGRNELFQRQAQKGRGEHPFCPLPGIAASVGLFPHFMGSKNIHREPEGIRGGRLSWEGCAEVLLGAIGCWSRCKKVEWEREDPTLL